MAIKSYTSVANSNVSLFPENMAPSSVNDSARQVQADIRSWYTDSEWSDFGDAGISRASATTFKITGDVTGRYLAERRLKCYDSTTTLYATIVSSSYSDPDTTITVELDNDTSLTASLTAVALASISPSNSSLSPEVRVGKNVLFGCDFSMNPWQRGTTFTTVASGTYTADMMIWNQSGVGVVDVLKTAEAPTVSQAKVLTSHCFHVDCTTVDASIAAADYYFCGYKVEGYDFSVIAQMSMTLSFWVKSTKTGIFCVAVQNSGGNRSYISEYTVNTTNTWEKKTITITASPSTGDWNYTNGIGLLIYFSLAIGSNYHTTANAWQASSYLATSNQVNGLDSIANDFKLALIKLESGGVATPWEKENEQQVLAKCQRYYFKTFNQGVTPAAAGADYAGCLAYNAQVAGVSQSGVLLSFPVTMRATPSFTFYNPGASGTAWRNITDGANSGASNYTSSYGMRGVQVTNDQAAGDGVTETLAIHMDAIATL